jgi:hypothetical protein
MKMNHSFRGWLLSIGFVCLSVSAAQATPSNFGMAAYWGNTSSAYTGRIPKGAYVVINPNSGALKLNSGEITSIKALIAYIRGQGGKVLGYVPTGYAQLTPAEQQRYKDISANLLAYKNTLGGVDGFFFDEAAYDNMSSGESPQLTEQQKCNGTPNPPGKPGPYGTPAKWATIRSTMKNAGVSGTVVWNAGTWGNNNCFVTSAAANEHVVILETSYSDYQRAPTPSNLNSAQSTANARGVKTWLLIHTANQEQMKLTLNGTTANYVYVTNLPGNGATWNSPPSYWATERSILGK